MRDWSTALFELKRKLPRTALRGFLFTFTKYIPYRHTKLLTGFC